MTKPQETTARVTLGQTGRALMFVAVYVAAAAGALVAIGLTGVVAFSLNTLLLTALVSVTAAAMLALYFHLFRRNKLTLADLGFHRPRPRMLHLLWQAPAAIIVCACAQGLFLWLLATLLPTTAGVTSDDSLAEITALPAPQALTAILVVGVLTPLWEEILFRGALLDGLSGRFGPGIAVVLSAVLFAAVHLVLPGFAYLFTLGVALALLRRFHDNLWAPVILHAANNALAVLVVLAAV